MYFICKERAFTLIELLITITILSILASVVIPSYHNFMQYLEYSRLLSSIKNHIDLSKNYAALYHSQIVICSSSDLLSCEKNQWHKGMLIFSDLNNNKKLDPGERVHRIVKTNLRYGSLTWSGGITNTHSISFKKSTGLPQGSQGSFNYYSFKSAQKNIRIVLSPMGHIRTELANCQ